MVPKVIIGISRFIFLLIVVIITVGIGAYAAFLTYQTIFNIPNVNVPSVLNKDITTARQVLQSNGLKMLIIDEPFSVEGNNLFVVSQSPSPGAEIKKNRTVEVEVRKTRVANQVPNLIGKTIPEAEAILLEVGYNIGSVAYAMHHQLTEGKIIAQNPNPGEGIRDNGAVNILVSKGLY
jgi:serine/threonine-protein kinase